MSLPNAVVIDACILVSISSNEACSYKIAEKSFDTYAMNGWEFFAPNVIISEGMFALCKKLNANILTAKDHDKAVESYLDYTSFISLHNNESSLMKRAVEIRKGYGCSRSADGIYIALAEELTKSRTTEFLTLDGGMKNQISNSAPTVNLNLLVT